MAHLAKLGALTDELVSLLTSTNAKDDPGRFFPYRETALRTIRSTNYLRTNQFDVETQLVGLEEKFRVYNEDPLADALRERLDNIASKNIKWAPEIFQLLLNLSDKPVTKSKLEDLDLLRQPEPDTGPPLKWKDLTDENPNLRDKSIWENIDFGAESSDADEYEDSQSELSSSTDTTGQSSIDEDLGRRPEEHIVSTADNQELDRVLAEQFWKKSPSVNGVKLETIKKPITELQVIREVLFMLSGFPTSLFNVERDDPEVIISSNNYTLKHASHEAFTKLIDGLAFQGSAIMTLRLWLRRPQSIALLQVLQSQTEKRILALDLLISQIQERFVGPTADVVVSMLSVQTEVTIFLRPLIRLSEIIQQLDTERYARAFWYLELLYDETCTSQMAGDDEIFAFMARLFLDCFQVYLRPMRNWMEDGELAKDDKVFFVSELTGEVELASIWQSRYKIRKTQAGALHAPKFLHAVANKIFTTGKSVVVLKHLNQFNSLQTLRTPYEPSMSFDDICNPSSFQLCPFPELFDLAFDRWVQSKHSHASSLLHKTLFDSCGLHQALEALSTVYLFADGALAAGLTNAVFHKLDTLNPSWNDRFAVTELAQSAFGSASSVSADRLRAVVLSLPRKFQDVSVCRKSVKVLSALKLEYRLSWPIQIIVIPVTTASYQAICTFLFQIRRSSHILTRQALKADLPNRTNSTDERALYYSLRSRLLWFTQSLYHHLTSLVIEPNLQNMRKKLREADDVDAMILAHENFIKSIKDQALLGSKLELIHKTIMKILDLSIKLEDAQTANALATKDIEDQQISMMDLSFASLGLQTSHRKPSRVTARPINVDSSEDEDKVDVDLSILSSTYDNDQDEPYVDKLRKMKAEFDRLVRFVASGLRGIARVGSSQDGRSWDLLGEMLETGLGAGQTNDR